ncbi:MAG: hypothetical protein UT32_C0015G0003 [Parcubacteria group bacterium GW2011_GWC2_39_14]|nr:MAG: hypothetical protein UT32_C0015G0003 [Parcubacteria group bacterium GW2011_GWC2_39_14]KKR54399.1 MAG: hypothetical protein UT91_C0016G0003 [Parcubacteria group bacterium GW2011_GWA2_40_23]
MANQEVTTNEIMEFLQTNMVTRDEFNDRVGNLEVRFDNLEGRFDNLEGRVGHLENQMVTKDYLDDKFAIFSAEIGKKINKQTERHETLVDILASKSILQEADIKRLKK